MAALELDGYARIEDNDQMAAWKAVIVTTSTIPVAEKLAVLTVEAIVTEARLVQNGNFILHWLFFANGKIRVSSLLTDTMLNSRKENTRFTWKPVEYGEKTMTKNFFDYFRA